MEAESEPWVLATGIPFDDLKGYRLEECVYWILDGLGAKDLEWRVGGVGGGTADGGRDIEAAFYLPDDAGRMERHQWWIECKGRGATVEKEAVVNACNNVTAYPEVERLIIATNSRFSNPTIQWVRDWQASHPQQVIVLWDRAELERMLSRQPSTVLRLFQGGLSLAGKLEAIRERYFNLMEYSSIDQLRAIWAVRDTLNIGPMERIALVANEFAHGDIDERPWCGGDDVHAASGALTMALFNFIYLFSKWTKTGGDEEPFVAMVAYLLSASLRHLDATEVVNLIEVALRAAPDQPMSQENMDYFLGPILDRLNTDLTLVCSADCPRFSRDDSLKGWQEDDPFRRYWSRYGRRGTARPGQVINARLERTNQPCVIGIGLSADERCRIYATDPTVKNLLPYLDVVAAVVRARSPLPRRKNSDIV